MKSNPERDSDERLVARFQSGERQAFDEIDRRRRAQLVRFLHFRTRSLEVAEELAQETLVRAYSTLDGLKRGEFLSGWLYRIAFRLFVDWTRRPNAVSLDAAAENADDGGANRFELTDSNAENPDAPSIRGEEKANLWRVAKEILTPDEFRAVWLRYVDDASDREIGVALGKTPGTVRVALTRARQKLAERLRAEEENETPPLAGKIDTTGKSGKRSGDAAGKTADFAENFVEIGQKAG